MRWALLVAAIILIGVWAVLNQPIKVTVYQADDGGLPPIITQTEE
jgi:hypothetical protein